VLRLWAATVLLREESSGTIQNTSWDNHGKEVYYLDCSDEFPEVDFDSKSISLVGGK